MADKKIAQHKRNLKKHANILKKIREIKLQREAELKKNSVV